MSVKQSIIDHHDFSTETDYLKPGESDFRNEICLNGKWDFQPVDLPDDFIPGKSIPDLLLPKPDGWELVKLKVPSPWNINGLVDGDGISGGDFVCYPSYPESWKQVKMGWLKRTVQVPGDWEGQSILLHFEAVCGHCQVYLDGQKVGEHFDNSMPQTYSLDDFVTPGKEHELWVGIRAPELFTVNNGKTKYTYPTGSFFNMNTTGIWQDVVLLGVPKVRIQDVFVQPDLSADQLRVQVTLENRSGQPASLSVIGVVKALQPFSFPDDGIQVLPHYDLENTPIIEYNAENITIAADAEVILTLEATVSGKLLQWDTDHPNLYATLITLEKDGKTTDRKYTRFGWRAFNIKDGDFYLNDRKVQVKADSWHFMGIPQMTRRYAFAWYQALKDAGGNGVRLHAMPYPTFYLEVADEMGVCVLDESAIWASHCQFNYDELVTWKRFYDHVTSLILRDRNFPSVMGWSVENEVRMALEPHFPSEETIAIVREKISKLLGITRELDPTRDWISVDGSQDWDGLFPTNILHYVRKEAYQKIKSEAGKPVGVGETTIAYFGTPTQAAAFGGDLAFQSIEGRMKGVAVEAYGDLQAQLLADFSYLSVFNLAWYSLKPMPLGHTHPENTPTVENGIIFGDYQEGKPGVQPERLGPYCTTLNPGYDPDLPLYAPWPMYAAIKAVYSPGGPLPSPYDAEIASPSQKPLPVVDQPESVTFFGESHGVAYLGLQAAGIQFSEDHTGNFLFADLTSLSPEQEKILRARVAELKSGGGTVFLSGLTPTSEDLLENLTGEKIEIFEREASSLVFAGEYANTDPLVDHFRLKELYFSEKDDYVIQRYGIRSEGFKKADVRNARTLLKACSCDWRMWNYRGESSKTGALYRSEIEMPIANALVKLSLGKTRVLLSTIEMREHRSIAERDRKRLWHKLMKAAGAEIQEDYGEEESYSTYTPAGQLLKNAQVKAILQDFILAVAAMDDELIAELSKINLRELVRTPYLNLTNKQLDEIDRALSGIPINGEAAGAETSSDLGKDSQALEGDQIVRVLAVGSFAGRDCASMLETDFLDGEGKIIPAQGDAIIRDTFLTAWQIVNPGPDGFCFKEMGLDGPKDRSASYMSFCLDSPRRLDDLLTEPNVPKLYLNLETACCLRVWVNGKEIFTQADVSAEPVKLQTPLPLGKGSNLILIKVVNENTDYIVKAYLSSSHEDFIGKLNSAVEQ